MKHARALCLLLVGFGLALGCVRLSEPDHFFCYSDADCGDGDRCPVAAGHCVAKDYCDENVRCLNGQHCESARCTTDACSEASEASDCGGYSCFRGACAKACAYSNDCAVGFHCEQEKCVAGAASQNTDQACTVAQDCSSGNCCRVPGGRLICSTRPCTSVAECASVADCRVGEVCTNQKCALAVAQGANGAPCQQASDCKSDSCYLGVCRGHAGYFDACTEDSGCEAGRLCCQTPGLDKKQCGDLDAGCSGAVGDGCEYAFQCVESQCSSNVIGFCTKPCATSAECGVSPWLVPNVCQANGGGQRTCLPGCTADEQCWDNISGTFVCDDAKDGSGSRVCVEG